MSSLFMNFFVRASDESSYFAKSKLFNIKQSKNLWISSKRFVLIKTHTKILWKTKRQSLKEWSRWSHCRKSIKIRSIFIFVRRMIIKKKKTSVKINFVFAIKFIYSVNTYIVSVNRTSEWKENFKMRNETRQKIQTKSFMIYSIKRVIDINILNELISSSKRKKRDENEKNDDDFHFNHANFAFVNLTLIIIYHSLMNSVIYDSNCNQSLIFDKTRFLKHDLISSNDQIKISDDHMQIEKYEIMLVWKQLKDKKIEMTFKKTAYISICFVILVFQSKLEKEEFNRDSFIKTLIHLKTNKQICETQKRFEVQLLEYNFISKNNQTIISKDSETTNSIQLSKNIMIKATSWQWHKQLEHCRSQMIDYLSKKWINNNDDSASKTIKCEICVVFKMHRLVQKTSTARVTKLYEMLYFNLIIYEIKQFDEIICIAHFIADFTHYLWIFSLTNHREKTLMLVFKDLINKCNCWE